MTTYWFNAASLERFSSPLAMTSAAACTFFTISSLSSNAGNLLDTMPSTTDLFGGSQRRGSKVPARSVSYSNCDTWGSAVESAGERMERT